MMGLTADQQKKGAIIAAFVLVAAGVLYYQLRDDSPAPAAPPVVVTAPARSASAAGAVVALPSGNIAGAAGAHPNIYTYLDANGVRHYTDVPDNNRYKLLSMSSQDLTESGDRFNPALLARATRYDAIIENAAVSSAVRSAKPRVGWCGRKCLSGISPLASTASPTRTWPVRRPLPRSRTKSARRSMVRSSWRTMPTSTRA